MARRRDDARRPVHETRMAVMMRRDHVACLSDVDDDGACSRHDLDDGLDRREFTCFMWRDRLLEPVRLDHQAHFLLRHCRVLDDIACVCVFVSGGRSLLCSHDHIVRSSRTSAKWWSGTVWCVGKIRTSSASHNPRPSTTSLTLATASSARWFMGMRCSLISPRMTRSNSNVTFSVHWNVVPYAGLFKRYVSACVCVLIVLSVSFSASLCLFITLCVCLSVSLSVTPAVLSDSHINARLLCRDSSGHRSYSFPAQYVMPPTW